MFLPFGSSCLHMFFDCHRCWEEFEKDSVKCHGTCRQIVLGCKCFLRKFSEQQLFNRTNSIFREFRVSWLGWCHASEAEGSPTILNSSFAKCDLISEPNFNYFYIFNIFNHSQLPRYPTYFPHCGCNDLAKCATAEVCQSGPLTLCFLVTKTSTL